MDRHLLAGLHLEVQEISAPIPDDLRWRTFEARDLIDLLEHLAFNNSFKFNRWSDGWTCSYFDAVLCAVQSAKESLGEVGVHHA